MIFFIRLNLKDLLYTYFRLTMADKKIPKNPQKFFCNLCDYNTSNLKDYNKHIATRKHKMLTSDLQKSPKNPQKYTCDCGKIYKHRQSLSKHKKMCNIESNYSLEAVIQNDNKLNIELIKDLILQNKDLQDKLFHSNNITNINNTTNNNQKLNISVFLNEHCKDAINFSDFIQNIEVSHEDLENNAQLGFVEGISKIINDNLNLLTIHERPIHCTDSKRDTLYLKDENVWCKEKDKIQKIFNKSIQQISVKSMQSLMSWKQTNPDYQDLDSDFSNKCIYMQRNSIAGLDRDDYYPKVMHKIAGNVKIDHSMKQ